ncbi:MAG: GIY-YIG nuclease family protein [Lacibacter sp.]|jgi:putative endonuclease
MAMPFFVYILYSSGHDRYYIGQTENPASRLERHNEGYEFATAPYVPWKLVCCIEKETRGEAMILERKLKNLNRLKLERFIAKYGVGNC